MTDITVYTSKTCAYCPQLKKWLTMKDVPFVELDRDDNLAEFTKVTKKSGYTSVPQTVLPSGKIIVGWNLPLLTKELL